MLIGQQIPGKSSLLIRWRDRLLLETVHWLGWDRNGQPSEPCHTIRRVSAILTHCTLFTPNLNPNPVFIPMSSDVWHDWDWSTKIILCRLVIMELRIYVPYHSGSSGRSALGFIIQSAFDHPVAGFDRCQTPPLLPTNVRPVILFEFLSFLLSLPTSCIWAKSLSCPTILAPSGQLHKQLLLWWICHQIYHLVCLWSFSSWLW